MSRYELNLLLVEAVRKINAGIKISLKACSLNDIPFAEKRPLNTSLSIAKLQTTIAWRFRSMSELCSEIAEVQFA
jgi:hypothetical protein